MSEWIKVSDHPPKNGQFVFVVRRLGKGIRLRGTCYYMFDQFVMKGKWGGKITHWMPAPDLPKEE